MRQRRRHIQSVVRCFPCAICNRVRTRASQSVHGLHQNTTLMQWNHFISFGKSSQALMGKLDVRWWRDSLGSFCCWGWGPATSWWTGSGWDDQAAGEWTRSSSCSPPGGHTAAPHHWSCPSLWLRPAQTDSLTEYLTFQHALLIIPHMYRHAWHVPFFMQVNKCMCMCRGMKKHRPL